MNKIKKTIMTLVLLMTAATGAWAEGYYNININFDPVYNPEFTFFMCDVMGPDMPSGTLGLWIDKSYTGSFRVENGMCSSEIHSLDAGDHTWYAEFIPEGGGEKSTEQRSFTIDQDFAYVYIDDPGQSSIEMGVGESRNFRGHVDGPESSEVNISSSNDNVAKFRASSSSSYGFEGYIDAVGAGTATITVSFAGNKNYKAAQSKTLTVTVLAPASAVEVAWNKTSKTGSFKMPGGNVELQVEYYPGMLVKPTNLVGGTLSIDGLTDTTLPAGFEKDAEGNIYVAKDTKFTVKAVPAEGYHLVGWSDDATNKELERVFTMTDDDFTVTATFSNEYDIAFQAANANTIQSGKATVKVGETAAEVKEGKLTGVKMNSKVTITAKEGYKFRKVEVKKGGAAAAVTYTELKGGEVLHVGDKIQVPESDKYWYPGVETLDYRYTYEVVRVNISGDEFEPTVTESETGAYYALHVVGTNNYRFVTGSDSDRLKVTATSDGIAVADNGTTPTGYHKYIFSVHEPSN